MQPVPGVDRRAVSIPGHPNPTIGDDGVPVKDGVYVILTREERRRNRVLALVSQGFAYEDIRRKVMAEFSCSKQTFEKDIAALSEFARTLNDSDDFWDIRIKDSVDKLSKLIAVNFDNANITYDKVLDAGLALDGKGLIELGKLQVASAKETRAGVESLVNVAGRRSQRWSPRQRVEVTPVIGGTEEQQEAVRRLLGEDPVLPTEQHVP